MSADRLDDLARFAAAADAADAQHWPRLAAEFAARHGAATARETLRFLSLFWGFPPALRALDLAAPALAAQGVPDARGVPDGSDAMRGNAQFTAVYGSDAPHVLARLAELDPHLRSWVLDHAYGRAYPGTALTLPERERLAVLALAASGCWKQCDSHLRACLRLGLDAALLHADAAAGGWLDAEQTSRLRARIAELAP